MKAVKWPTWSGLTMGVRLFLRHPSCQADRRRGMIWSRWTVCFVQRLFGFKVCFIEIEINAYFTIFYLILRFCLGEFLFCLKNWGFIWEVRIKIFRRLRVSWLIDQISCRVYRTSKNSFLFVEDVDVAVVAKRAKNQSTKRGEMKMRKEKREKKWKKDF